MEFVLGIDPSLTSTGWCVMNKETMEVIEVGKICTTNKYSDDDRITKITYGLIRLCVKYHIAEASMEDGFVGGNMKVSLQLAKLRGGITIGLRIYRVKITCRQPCDIKMAFTGKGNATKEEVAQMIIDLFKDNTLVQDLGPFIDRTCKAKNSDIYDAISIVYAHLKEGQKVA